MNKTLAQKAAENLVRDTENTVSYYTIRKEGFDLLLADLEESVPSLTVYLCEYSVDISFSGSKSVLNTVIGVLRKHGFNSGERPKEGDVRYATYWTNNAGHRLWVSFSSTSCRRVKTGVQMVEQPVYEVICE